MKKFTEHSEACNYAKVNPGFIVISNGVNWIVGERKTILEFIKQKSSNTNKRSNYNNKRSDRKNDYTDVKDHEDPNAVEFKLYMNEINEELDPDDWNRSNEEGWFYED